MKTMTKCFASLAFCLLIFAGTALAADDAKSYYVIGNSLTWDTSPGQLDGDVQWHVDCGKSLPYIFENPDKPCVKTSTLWPSALKDKQYDVISVQPHYGSTLEQDATVISEWMAMQPKAEFVIHTGWARVAERVAETAKTEAGGEMAHSTAYIDALTDLLKRTNPERIVRRTFAMDALELIAADIAGEKSPFDEVADVHRDAIHINSAGRYLMHNLMRQGLGQKGSAKGFDSVGPSIRTYLNTVLERLKADPPAVESVEISTVVYVSESKDKKIAMFSLHEPSGELARIGEVEMSGAPGCLALDAEGDHVYAAVRSSSEFATLKVDRTTGQLSILGTAPAAGSAAYVFPDRTGKWLFGAYYGEGLVSVSRIDDQHLVSGEPTTVLDIGKKAHCVQVDAANQFVFVPHPMDLNRVDQFAFDAASGLLARNDPEYLEGAPGAGPRHLQFHPNGKWVYLVNEQGKSVSLCNYDAAVGTLTLRQTLSTIPEDWDQGQGSCADIEISADGRFVYASNRGHDSIAAFSIDQKSGELTSLGQTPTEETPRSFNLMPVKDQALVVAAGQGSNTLIVYRRDPKSGELSPLRTYECGGSPAWVLGVRIGE